MPALRELQASMAAALLGADASPAARHIEGDGLPPGARLDIYRHHVFTTLTAALKPLQRRGWKWSLQVVIERPRET